MKYGLMHIVLGAFLLSAGVAHASTVDYSGDDVNMKTVAVNQSGTITDNVKGGSDINIASGKIAPNTVITFSYSGLTGSPGLTAQGSYNYTSGKVHYNGTSFASSNGSSSQAALTFALANITGSSGIAEIINNSQDMVSFLVELTGIFGKGFKYTYNVAAVPLPGSLPLFLTGLMGLVAYRHVKAKKAASL